MTIPMAGGRATTCRPRSMSVSLSWTLDSVWRPLPTSSWPRSLPSWVSTSSARRSLGPPEVEETSASSLRASSSRPEYLPSPCASLSCRSPCWSPPVHPAGARQLFEPAMLEGADAPPPRDDADLGERVAALADSLAARDRFSGTIVMIHTGRPSWHALGGSPAAVGTHRTASTPGSTSGP
jgi:hypothetical protein